MDVPRLAAFNSPPVLILGPGTVGWIVDGTEQTPRFWRIADLPPLRSTRQRRRITDAWRDVFLRALCRELRGHR